MPRHPSYSTNDVERMRALLLQGSSVSSVAKSIGVSQKVVVTAIKKHTGMTATELRMSLRPLDRFKELLAKGHSVLEVAAMTGFNEGTIRYTIKRSEGLSIAGFRQRHGLLSQPIPDKPPDSEGTISNSPVSGRLRLPSSNRTIGRPSRTYQKTCLFCGASFTTKIARQRFCSLSCNAKSRPPDPAKTARPRVTRTCERCGRQFKTKRANQKYCGDKCRTACISKDKTRLSDIPCAHCERLFRPAQRIQTFCSKECAYKGRRSSSHVNGNFKLDHGKYVRFESSYELVFLLFASQHPAEYQNVRRCDFCLDYEFEGQPCRYFPDFLYEDSIERTRLVEIKSTGTVAFAPHKTEAKLGAGRLWCKQNNAGFVYLTDDTDAFVEMCDFVVLHHNLDILQQIQSNEALRKIVRRCVECGKAIPRRGRGVAAYLRRKFCSEACRRKSKYGKKERVPSSRHVCPQCGKAFFGDRNQKFCSKTCYTSSQHTLKEKRCPVCGRGFQPDSSSRQTCSLECGTVFRSASRKGMTVTEYLDWKAKRKPLPERLCGECGSSFVPRSTATKKCSECRRAAKVVWTLALMIERLREVRAHLGGRIPSYSEIYDSRELREKFNSCSLAGAIFRFNQAKGVGSYQDFLEQYLGWRIPGRLDKTRTEEVFGKLVKECGCVPFGLGKIDDLFGHKGHAFEAAFQTHYGMTVAAYCKQRGIARKPRKECGFQ